MTNKKKLLAFVPNGATNDNRVVREAESLLNQGFDVTLCGIITKQHNGAHAITAGGVNVRRIHWRRDAYLKMALLAGAAGAAALFALASLVVILYSTIWSPLVSAVSEWALSKTIEEPGTGAAMLVSILESPTFLAVLLVPLIALPVLYVTWKVVKWVGQFLTRALMASPFASRFLSYYQVSNRYAELESNPTSGNFLVRLLTDPVGAPTFVVQMMLNYFTLQTREYAMYKLGMEIQPDIVHCHEVTTLKAGAMLKRKLGCKLVYEAHEIYDDLAAASASLSARHKKTHRKYLKYIDAMITVNPMIGKYYTDTYSEVSETIVVPNSVYPKRVTYDGRLHEAAKLDPDANILLYQGGFSPFRGLPNLINAAYELPEDWFVVMMGWGNLEQELMDQSEALEIETAARYRKRMRTEFLAEINENNRPDPVILSRSEQRTNGDEKVSEQQEIELSHLLNFNTVQTLTEDESYASLTEPERKRWVTDLLNTIQSNTNQVHRIELDVHINKQIEASVQQKLASGSFRKVRFVPPAPHSELVEYTSGATIGIIPYENTGLNHWNCSPNKIWEYPNAGVPILASRLAFLHQMISSHGIGWTMPSESGAKDIVDFFVQLKPEDLAEKQANCATFIQEDNYHLHETRLIETFAKLGS